MVPTVQGGDEVNPDTGEIKRWEEIEDLPEEEREKFVRIPGGELTFAAEKLMEFQNAVKKEQNRKRNKVAKASRKRNRP